MARLFQSGILEQIIDELNSTSEIRKRKAAHTGDLPHAKRKVTDHSDAGESTNDTEEDSPDQTDSYSVATDSDHEVEEKDGENENEDGDPIAEYDTASHQQSDTTPRRGRMYTLM